MKIRVRHVVGVVMAGGALVVAGCGDDARVNVGADSAGPVRSSAPPGGEALTKVALDADAPGRVWRLPLPANARVSQRGKSSEYLVTDPTVQRDEYRELRERADRERIASAGGATGAAERGQAPTQRPKTLVEQSATHIEISDIGLIDVGLLKGDLFTDDLIDVNIESIKGLSEERIEGKRVQVSSHDGSTTTFCWHQFSGEAYCVGGDVTVAGDDAVEEIDRISRAIVKAIARTK